MNCRQIQQWLIERDDQEFPQEVQRHLDQCADCRKTHEQAQSLRQLLQLKRDEQPPAGLADQCAANVLRRLKAGEEPSLIDRWREYIFWPEVQMKLVLAAAAALLFTVGLLWVSGRFEGGKGENLADHSTNLTTDQELPAGQMLDRMSITNVDPAKIEYGTQPSRVVDFEK